MKSTYFLLTFAMLLALAYAIPTEKEDQESDETEEDPAWRRPIFGFPHRRFNLKAYGHGYLPQRRPRIGKLFNLKAYGHGHLPQRRPRIGKLYYYDSNDETEADPSGWGYYGWNPRPYGRKYYY